MKNNMIKKTLFIAGFISIALSGCAYKQAQSSNADSDQDGIVNYKDLCKNTPKGASVNKYGCSLDSDFDGVIDLYDKCPNTSASDLVNSSGCTIKTLK